MSKSVKRFVQSTNATIKRSLSTSSASRVDGGAGRPKTWVHPPEALEHGRVEYAVKWLGSSAVSGAKGSELVREALHKIRFQLSSSGESAKKQMQRVLLQVSVDGLVLVNAKSGLEMARFPLHRISFCADDKQDSRVFSFIASTPSSSGAATSCSTSTTRSEHECFVFLSDKMAEEITLSIGEAFDLAYRKYLNEQKSMDGVRKEFNAMRRRLAELEVENRDLKRQLADVEKSRIAAAVTAEVNMTKWESFNVVGDEAPPQLPNSPIPPKPPASLAVCNNNSSTAIGNNYEPFHPRESTDGFGLSPFESHQQQPSTSWSLSSRMRDLREQEVAFERGLDMGKSDGAGADLQLLRDFDPLVSSPAANTNGQQ